MNCRWTTDAAPRDAGSRKPYIYMLQLSRVGYSPRARHLAYVTLFTFLDYPYLIEAQRN